MYLGANSSPVRCRLYAKGKQPGYRSAGRPDWVRLEVQVRPQKTARKSYSAISADDTWGASESRFQGIAGARSTPPCNTGVGNPGNHPENEGQNCHKASNDAGWEEEWLSLTRTRQRPGL